MSTTKKKEQANAAASSKKENAAQKIDALGKKLVEHQKNFLILADEIDQLKAVIAGLSRRLNAVIEASESGNDITNKSVGDVIVQQNVKELENKVSFLVEQGVMTKGDETTASGINTFLVGREVNEEGIVVNPRVQFAINSLTPEFQSKLTGLKVGDKKNLREGDPSLEVMEIYNIVNKNVEKKFEKEELAEEAAQTPPKTE